MRISENNANDECGLGKPMIELALKDSLDIGASIISPFKIEANVLRLLIYSKVISV